MRGHRTTRLLSVAAAFTAALVFATPRAAVADFIKVTGEGPKLAVENSGLVTFDFVVKNVTAPGSVGLLIAANSLNFEAVPPVDNPLDDFITGGNVVGNTLTLLDPGESRTYTLQINPVDFSGLNDTDSQVWIAPVQFVARQATLDVQSVTVNAQVTVADLPEPGTLATCGTGILLALACCRRGRSAFRAAWVGALGLPPRPFRR